ncbi:MAG: TolC family protein [Acidobacteriaceae bacterium]
MKFLFAACVVAALSTRPAYAQPPGDNDPLAGFTALFTLPTTPAIPGSDPVLTLDQAEDMALARDPEIQVAARRVAVLQAQLPAAGALNDPSAMYSGWSVPLAQPWNYNDAQNMFTISQTFPGFGKRALRTSVAQSEVDVARAQLDEVRLTVRVQVHKAFDDLLLAEEELRIHDEHMRIAQQSIAAARIRYSVGKVSQQDMLKAEVALTELAEHMIRFDRDADVARARLNTLLGRDPEAPLTVRGQYAVLSTLPSAQRLEDVALRSRPDLIAAQAAAESSHKQQLLAQKAYAPDFTVTAGYMLMPYGYNMRNTYQVEGSMNLPWLNRRKHDAEIAEATAEATEQDAEWANLCNQARGAIAEKLVEAQAEQSFASLYHDRLLPQAEATLESSIIAYENDKTDFLNLLDSQMTVINADLAWVQAAEEFDTRLADLELATGATINQLEQLTPKQTQQPTPEVKP